MPHQGAVGISDRRYHVIGQIVLSVEQDSRIEGPIEGLPPDLFAALDVQQLRGQSQSGTGLPQRPLQHVTRSGVSCTEVLWLRRDEQVGEARKPAGDVLAQGRGKIRQLRVVTPYLDGCNSNPGFGPGNGARLFCWSLTALSVTRQLIGFKNVSDCVERSVSGDQSQHGKGRGQGQGFFWLAPF